MAEAEVRGRGSRRMDAGGIFWSLVFVVVALIGFSGNGRWLMNTSTWWIAATVIAVLGLLMVFFRVPAGVDRAR